MTTYLQITHELKVFFELNSLHTCRCVRCREKYGEKSIRGRIKCRTVLVSHGVAVYRTDIAVSRTTTPIMCWRGCENAMTRTGGEVGLSDSVGWLSCASCVCTTVHMSTRTCVCKGIMFGWQTGALPSYQWFWDLFTGTLLQDRTIDADVRWWWPKLCGLIPRSGSSSN